MRKFGVNDVVALLIIGLVVVCVLRVVLDSPYDDRNFEKKLWAQAGKMHNFQVRAEMAEDICQRIRSKPTYLREVSALLGKPDSKQGGRVLYYLGVPRKAMRIGASYLEITSDAAGRVQKVDVYVDD